MSKKKVKSKLSLGDEFRALLTETLPDEIPIIFNNQLFYNHLNNQKRIPKRPKPLLLTLIDQVEGKRSTKPYKFVVSRGGSGTFRELFFLHPSAQKRVCHFYSSYDDFICYLTTKSPISIRHPRKITLSVSYYEGPSVFDKYKRAGISTIKTDLKWRHLTSYFSYGGFPRPHRFTNSITFLNLEQKFHHLYKVDIKKCFSNIYTHSISWAIYGKSIAKKRSQGKRLSGFGEAFDDLMMAINDRETNGIAVGPEVSRIFSEIILQKIDLSIGDRLLNSDTLKGEFEIKRYVDDFYIFAEHESDAERIVEYIEIELMKYNLQINEGKSSKTSRPFKDLKSVGVFSVKKIIKNLFDEIFTIDRSSYEFTHPLRPKSNLKTSHLRLAFAENISDILKSSNLSYSDISSYVINSFSNKLKSFLEVSEKCHRIIVDHQEPEVIRTLKIFFDIIFDLYSYSPSEHSSYKVSEAIILILRYNEKYFKNSKFRLPDYIFERANEFLKNRKVRNRGVYKSDVLDVQSLNIILSLTEIKARSSVGNGLLLELVRMNNSPSYFTYISLLYYCGGESEQIPVIQEIEEKLIAYFESSEDVNICNANYFCLALDSITCPFVSIDFKETALKLLLKKAKMGFNDKDIDRHLRCLETTGAFVDWNSSIDLLNSLEKKLVGKVY